uniref:Uncharacterized protein n=1 Tax=Chenopodium quinoa TaxID=63459 RepID=A0A803LPV9_CHEQI
MRFAFGKSSVRLDLERLITVYFTDLFATSSPTGFQGAIKGIGHVVSDEMNASLDKEPTEEEIKAALFQMHPNKAPRPDGIRAIFYQKFRHIVEHDIVNFVSKWWRGDRDLNNINNTCIA